LTILLLKNVAERKSEKSQQQEKIRGDGWRLEWYDRENLLKLKTINQQCTKFIFPLGKHELIRDFPEDFFLISEKFIEVVGLLKIYL